MSAMIETKLHVLRPMRSEDVACVMEIEQRVYPFPWTEGIFRDCIHVGYCCWVCEQYGAVVGYVVMSIGAAEAHLLNLCVHPDWQGQGIGTQMLEYVVQLAQQHQATSVFLEVRPTNKKAIKLYHAHAFRDVGTRKNYYPAQQGRENALILERKL